MEFNTINFKILELPPYIFFSYLGFLAATITYMILISKKEYEITVSLKIYFISCLGLIVGAKLFGILSGMYRNIGTNTVPIFSRDLFSSTGIVFYGGLFGFLLMYKLGTIIHKTKIDRYAIDVVAVSIPLFHFFGRIGCFAGGCCYGEKTTCGLAVYYTTYIDGIVDTSFRVPIQLIEATIELLLFLYLLYLFQKNTWKNQNLLKRYLVIYALARFILEFWRGDISRGIINDISFGQIISLGIVFFWLASYLVNMFLYKVR